MKSGTLPAARLENFHRLVRELAFEQEKAEKGLVRSERKRWKGIAKFAKEINKGRGEEEDRGITAASCDREQTPRGFMEWGPVQWYEEGQL